MNEDTILWMGKRIEDMEKEELVHAMRWLVKRFQEEMSPQNMRYKAVGRARSFVRTDA